MTPRAIAAAGLLLASIPLISAAEAQFDAAKAFGARPSVEDLSLSPDGMSVAFVAPTKGQGSVVFVQSLAKGAPRASKPILGASGKPERLGGCDWVSNQRLVCSIYGVVASSVALEPVQFTRLVAINTDGTKLQLLSTRNNSYTRGMQLGGGNVIDWLPDEDGAVLMTRIYLPDEHTGSHIGSSKRGIAVDRVDTLTLASRTIEQPREDAVAYISDGHGGDVLDAGKWLVAQGIARADKLAVVGWSYGGYAALQSAVVDPSVYKAVIAIAPVTDLPDLKEQHRDWSDFLVLSREIGEGPHVREGSPALNAAKIKVPVLMFHGEMDRNVLIRQSKEMADHLSSAGVPHELVTWPDLDHQLDDSDARAEMLRKSEAFLRHALNL